MSSLWQHQPLPSRLLSRAGAITVKLNTLLRAIFWAGLLLFLAWDWSRASPIDLRQEPPLFAAGSGQEVSGGLCSMATGEVGN